MTNRVRVKICGLTRAEDAQCSIDSGAEFLGLIFTPSSPRHVSIEQARAIIEGIKPPKGSESTLDLDSPIRWVGVFQNQGLKEIQELLVQLPLDYVQMHSPTDALFRAALPVPVFQAQPLDPTQFISPAAAGAALLEPQKGSGITINDWLHTASGEDWRRLQPWNETFPLLLAGGLTPDNVLSGLELLHKKQCAPFALDVASGVEEAPGRKDWAKIQAFCTAVHAVPSNFSGDFLLCDP
jgi:phosphoribosylanthranilate isomerase